jgi:RNA polymerase sigma-70 factor (ECF subfamily)
LARRFSPREAEDAVQEIFLDLWKSAARFDPAVASDTTFVAMIARRRLIDRRRRLGRRPDVPGVATVPVVVSSDPGPERGAEASLAAREVEKLAPEQRQVLLMATCQGLSHDEIAQVTGLPLGTVKSHLRRGLLQIRASLCGVLEEEEPT